ncbi:accessory gene regulator B family protein [Paenibacillus chitinolyticus]|uniref:accessory gene regulator B family protein n=1 Tax=Paenibacillus chitinolyticus TaxID=79263 RepID=UPI002DB8E826|nr:accessory gene regulator B family protein [Paenibacillus chitinolyticus]MEC0248882.1 accessory gene regulator B family protein [Paenibacillus chitinolyticus]
MDVVDKIAIHFAETIHKNAKESSSVAVLKYAIAAVLNFLVFFLIVTFICSVTGHFIDGLIASLAFPALRYFSGGFHLKSATACNVISAALVLLAVLTPIGWNWWIVLLAATILAFTAPNNVKRSKLPAKYYPVLKIIAVGIVLSNFIFHSDVLAKVFLLQSLTTLGVFQKILDGYKF